MANQMAKGADNGPLFTLFYAIFSNTDDTNTVEYYHQSQDKGTV